MLAVRLHESCRLSEVSAPANKLFPKISKLLDDYRFFETIAPSRPSSKTTRRPSSDRLRRVLARLPETMHADVLRAVGAKRMSDRPGRDLLDIARHPRTLETAKPQRRIEGFGRLNPSQLLQVCRGGSPSMSFEEVTTILDGDARRSVRLAESGRPLPSLSVMAEAAKVLWADGQNYP